jgi:hypothetical protein
VSVTAAPKVAVPVAASSTRAERLLQRKCACGSQTSFLLDPSSLKPTKADEPTVKLMNEEFPPLKGFLEQVLANVKKACPK